LGFISLDLSVIGLAQADDSINAFALNKHDAIQPGRHERVTDLPVLAVVAPLIDLRLK
jgi:hypothetical protein